MDSAEICNGALTERQADRYDDEREAGGTKKGQKHRKQLHHRTPSQQWENRLQFVASRGLRFG